MQDWDSRIEKLKANIDSARKKWVLPYLEQVKVDEKPVLNDAKTDEKNHLKNRQIYRMIYFLQVFIGTQPNSS